MKLRALLLVLALLLATFAVMAPVTADGEESRAPYWRPIKLYAQINPTTNTLTTEPSGHRSRPTNTISFTSVELEENLLVQGVNVGVGVNLGLKARIGVSASLQIDATVQVLDDGDVIAEKEMTIPSIETRWDWEMPFIDDIDTYRFTKSHVITLRVTTSRNANIQTDTNSYLSLRCGDHLHVTVDTYNVDDRKTSTFYPNDLLENRHIFVEGFVENPFGLDDIGGVNISIKRPNGSHVVQDQAAEVGEIMNYTYDWAYASGLPSGSYEINVTGRDQQGNEFFLVGSLNMAEYGLLISAEDEEGGAIFDITTPGTPAIYTLTILNIGGKSADVTMDEGNAVDQWLTSFSKRTFKLDAGDDTDVTFEVKPSAQLEDGAEAIYTVTATASNDPNVPKAKDYLEVETYVVNEVDLLVQPENPDPRTVGVGGTVDHTFTVSNRGTFNTNVDLTRTGVPQEWKAVFVGSRVQDNTIDDLRPQEVVEVTLRVTAPDHGDIKKASVKVRVQSQEYPDEYEERTFVTNLVIGLVLTPTTPTNVTQDPGDSFSIFFDARNNDPTTEHTATFTVEQDTSAWPSSSFTFTPNNAPDIDPDHTVRMGLQVVVPATAVAGTFRFTVKGVVDGNSQVFSTFEFSVRINVHHEVVVRLDPHQPELTITTDEESIIYLYIENRGNVQETVNITVELTSSDVEVRMNDAMTSIIIGMPVAAGAEAQIKIGFKAKDTATHSQEMTVTISVKAASDSVPTENNFKLRVELTSSQLFLDYMYWGVIIIIMLIMMAGLLLWNPRKRRAVEEPKDEGDTDAAHGAVVRQ